MVYILEKDCLKTDSIENIRRAYPEPDQAEQRCPAHFCIITFDELKTYAGQLGISEKTVGECFRSEISKFESHDGFDFIAMNIPDDDDQRKNPHRVCIYLADRLLVFVSNPYGVIEELASDLQTEGVKNISLGRIISLFFDKLTFDDSLVLEKMEKEIAELEEDLLLSKDSELIDDFVAFRKKLRTLKRYYEQLLEISEAIEQNENGLIEKTVLRYFKFHTGRVTRLYSGVLNLRDYVTQVREAYQAQIDINLNKVMKFFTVITSVFLPLTLIAGWYGMNLKMPEFAWNYGYPFVIALSIAAAGGSLIYFKKNKWF